MLISFFVWRLFLPGDDVKVRERIVKEQNYYGTIIDKYHDPNNHNHLTIELEDGTRITLFPVSIFSELAIGDSIVKFKDSLNFRVLSRDRDYIVDLMCSDYWE